jgi:signal transduction histidine kinase
MRTFVGQELSHSLRHAANGQPVLSSDSRGGNGLRNMQARAAELGAELKIETAPGAGTRYWLSVPL